MSYCLIVFWQLVTGDWWGCAAEHQRAASSTRTNTTPVHQILASCPAPYDFPFFYVLPRPSSSTDPTASTTSPAARTRPGSTAAPSTEACSHQSPCLAFLRLWMNLELTKDKLMVSGRCWWGTSQDFKTSWTPNFSDNPVWKKDYGRLDQINGIE